MDRRGHIAHGGRRLGQVVGVQPDHGEDERGHSGRDVLTCIDMFVSLFILVSTIIKPKNTQRRVAMQVISPFAPFGFQFCLF